MKTKIEILSFLFIIFSIISCNNKPNLVFIKLDKSKSTTSHDPTVVPTTVISSDNKVIANYIDSSGWIIGLDVYFYLENLGGNGEEVINIIYSDDLGTTIKKEKKINLEKSKKYKVKITISFVANVHVTVSHGQNRINKLEIILPNENKESFETKIPSWQGNIKNIELIEVE